MDEQVNKYGVALREWATLSPQQKDKHYKAFSNRKIWTQSLRAYRERSYGPRCAK